MYLECVSCPKIGVTCDGPNFYAMTPPQIIAWCKERKKARGLTNEKIADMCGMPKGTVDSLFSNKHPDFKFGTIAPILKVLIGGDWTGAPCPSASSDEEKELRERVKQLESDIQRRDDKIQDLKSANEELKSTNESMKTLITNTNKRHAASQDFLRDQIRYRNKAIAIMGAALGLALTVIVGALIVDRLNGDIGFIWLDKLSKYFQTNSLNWFNDWIA